MLRDLSVASFKESADTDSIQIPVMTEQISVLSTAVLEERVWGSLEWKIPLCVWWSMPWRITIIYVCVPRWLSPSLSHPSVHTHVYSLRVCTFSLLQTHTQILSLCVYIYTHIYTHIITYMYTQQEDMYIYIYVQCIQKEKENVYTKRHINQDSFYHLDSKVYLIFS